MKPLSERLQAAWDAVNAMGSPAADDPLGRQINAQVDAALAEIEAAQALAREAERRRAA